MNYIRFWQSSGESEKTAIRVDTKHEQMVKEGIFRGGIAPYGYDLIKSGIENKKGKELMKLVISEETKNIVKDIFNLVYLHGYGGSRIASYLNENHIYSSTGSRWNSGTINYMLRNPIYKGYMTYKKRTTDMNDVQTNLPKEKWILSEKPLEDLVIVDEIVWDKVQEIRNSRIPSKTKKDDFKRMGGVSPLLLVGMIKCGHCGSPLTTTYNYKNWILKDGTKKKKVRTKYRCSGKALKKTDCDGQTIYAKNKIETTVLDEIKQYLDKLNKVDIENEIETKQKDILYDEKKELKHLKKISEESYKKLDLLNKEVIKSLQGESSFKPELLSNLIQEKENEINTIRDKIEKLEQEIKNKTLEINDMKQLQKYIVEWENQFEKASDDEKKIILSYIIDEVIVYRDEIDIKVRPYINDFIKLVNKQQYNNLDGESA